MAVDSLNAKVRHIIEFNQFLSIHILHIRKNTGGVYCRYTDTYGA